MGGHNRKGPFLFGNYVTDVIDNKICRARQNQSKIISARPKFSQKQLMVQKIVNYVKCHFMSSSFHFKRVSRRSVQYLSNEIRGKVIEVPFSSRLFESQTSSKAHPASCTLGMGGGGVVSQW
jgi:hypothetical protein